MEENKLEYAIERFRKNFCPRGYLDVKTAIIFADEFGYSEDELLDIVDEFLDSCGIKEQYSKADPVYCIYDHVLQMARNDIDAIAGVDIQNDYSFDTYGNYMATSYDYKTEDCESLAKDLEGYRDELDENTIKFLEYIEIKKPEQAE